MKLNKDIWSIIYKLLDFKNVFSRQVLPELMTLYGVSPNKYKVSPELTKLLDLKPFQTHNHLRLTVLVCTYIKNNNLVDTADKRFIIPDNAFSLVFGSERLTYGDLQSKLRVHMFMYENLRLD